MATPSRPLWISCSILAASLGKPSFPFPRFGAVSSSPLAHAPGSLGPLLRRAYFWRDRTLSSWARRVNSSTTPKLASLRQLRLREHIIPSLYVVITSRTSFTVLCTGDRFLRSGPSVRLLASLVQSPGSAVYAVLRFCSIAALLIWPTAAAVFSEGPPSLGRLHGCRIFANPATSFMQLCGYIRYI